MSNRGVFLCIRCSGMHRGMGTHISKVKSVDLDVWTPEQMEVWLQEWLLPTLHSCSHIVHQEMGQSSGQSVLGSTSEIGAHPPRAVRLFFSTIAKSNARFSRSKIESFIRSKYESKRWAMEGPPPDDPSILDSAGGSLPPPTIQPPSSSEQGSPLSYNVATSSSTRTSTAVSATVPRQQQTHQLLSANYANRLTKENHFGQSSVTPPPESAPALEEKAHENDLFSLDFRGPLASTPPVPEPRKDVKQDILSLFSSNAVAAASAQATPTTLQNYSLNWQGVPQQQPAATTSMMGTGGTGMWGVSSGWAGSVPAVPPQPNIWNTSTPTVQSQSNIFDTNSIWGGTSASNTTTTTTRQDPWASTSNTAQKKDEVFGDIWGSFK